MATRQGRRHKTPGGIGLLIHYWWAVGLIAAAGLLCLWQVAVAATTDVPLTNLAPTVRALAAGKPVAGIPGGGWRTITFGIILVVALAGLGLRLLQLLTLREARKPGAGMASRADHRRVLSLAAVRKREARLWPDPDAVPDNEFAQLIGTTTYGLREEETWAGQETHVAVLAPTGVGKTYRLMSRAALDAPGALVMTSTRPDVLDIVAQKRLATKGKVWVFDLLNLASWPDRMCWDFVAGCEDEAVARARAGQIIKGGQKKKSGSAGGGDSNSEFFQDNARDALQCYLHAAALDGRTIREVVAWATNFENTTEPEKILRSHPDADEMLGRRLRSLRTGAPETVASTRNTLDQGLSALALRRISSQFDSSQEGADLFDPAEFVRSTDTLVIIADDNNPTDVTNLAAMMLDEVFQQAKQAARRSPSERLQPPLRAVLDEVANIAPIPKFPEMLSDLRAYGIQIIFAIQSGAQARRTWGNEGAQMIIDNAGAVLVMGGIKDSKVLKDFSDLAGKVDVIGMSTQTRNFGMTRGNQTLTENERTTLRSEEIAHLPEGYALLFTGAIPPARVHLPGWTERPDADRLAKWRSMTAERRLMCGQRDEEVRA